ncbi:MAG TPA: calcium-binding protein [Magnetospirillum sp.]|nr:calcium-binding protein [Magnetospirillum sp.]
MKWAFPTLENPTIIDLSKTGSQDWWQFGANEDVIFIGANTPRTLDKLQTDGGRNIVVLGGDFQPTGDSRSATLHFLNLNGSVHVEGVHIDSKNSSQDGIAVAGAPGHQPDVTVQNCVIENIHGTEGGVHADVFQTHGSVGNMRFYNVTGDTSYQGFFISPQYDPPHKSADFENVNISYNGGSGYTYQYWFLDGDNQKPYPVTLKNVYATERSGQTAETGSVWPKEGMGDLGAVRVGNQITWPKMPYKGAITVGEPAKNFGDTSKVGLNFKVDAAGVHTGAIGSGTTTAPTTATHTDGGTATTTDSHDAAHPASGAPTNWINSTDAHAKVVGTDGNDQIAGVEGKADVGGLAGGKGDDTYIVDKAGDKVIELAGEGTDTVISYAPATKLDANVENLTIGGTKAAVGFGNDGNNTLIANDAGDHLNGLKGDDLLVGGKGADVLNGGIGADTMKGGAGNDTYVVSRATDKVVEASGEGVDTVKTDISYKLGQYVENVELYGSNNVNATGNAWHNVVVGNNGNNVLDGGAGNDRLFGAKGADKLIGGDGQDTFVLKMAGAGTDTIKDFKLGTDNLDMHNVLKSVGASNASQAIKDHLLEVVQNGSNTEVIAHAPGHEPAKVAVIENVDAAALLKTSDHWS